MYITIHHIRNDNFINDERITAGARNLLKLFNILLYTVQDEWAIEKVCVHKYF